MPFNWDPVRTATVGEVIVIQGAPPARIQRSRKKGSRIPTGTVCVTRPGKWGNPFSDADTFSMYLELAIHGGIDPIVRSNPAMERIQWIADNIEQLRGKNLACFCSLDKPCHADSLLRWANGGG